MTALTAWVSYDSRRPSGAYIATDSRITFTAGGVWDHGQKAFASSRYPDVFGYVGDVLFPSLFLGRHLAALDSQALMPPDASLADRQRNLHDTLTAALSSYPRRQQYPFKIVHIGREGHGGAAHYATQVLSFRKPRLDAQILTSLDSPGVLEIGSEEARSADAPYLDGTGSGDVFRALARWNESRHAHTSRAVFSAHCDALTEPSVTSVGGAPQLVGLYRVENGRYFGVHASGSATLFGSPAHGSVARPGIEFRNGLFERVDRRGARLRGAKVHTR